MMKPNSDALVLLTREICFEIFDLFLRVVFHPTETVEKAKAFNQRVEEAQRRKVKKRDIRTTPTFAQTSANKRLKSCPVLKYEQAEQEKAYKERAREAYEKRFQRKDGPNSSSR